MLPQYTILHEAPWMVNDPGELILNIANAVWLARPPHPSPFATPGQFF